MIDPSLDGKACHRWGSRAMRAICFTNVTGRFIALPKDGVITVQMRHGHFSD